MTKESKRKPLILRLYVAGTAPHSTRAITNIRALCERHAGKDYELDIVDVVREPLRALNDGILVTPTLVRIKPEPVQTLLGDLSEEALVVSALWGGRRVDEA